MNDNEMDNNSNGLSINVVEQKENYSSSQKAKRNYIRKISLDLKNLENKKESEEPEKKDFFPKITNQNNNVNNINDNKNINNINKDEIINNEINNNIINNEINNNAINKNSNNNIINNEVNNNINNNINNENNNDNINSDEKNIIPEKEEKPLKIALDKKTSNKFKIKLDNIIKNDFEYNNVLPLIQKGSYLTGLPDSLYNNNTKNNPQTKNKYKESSKILKNLKEKEKSLNKEITTIKNKKQKLSNISYGNTNASSIERNINNYEERRLKSIENNLIEKLDEVKNQIKDIIQREEALKKNKKSLIQNFLKKYENEENAENLSKKFHLNNNNTDRAISKLQKDCNIKNLNRFKNKEKSEYKMNQEENLDEIEQKKIYLKEQNEKEKEIVKRRKMKIDEQMSKLKEKVKTSESRPIEKYLFYKIANDFEKKEKLFMKNIKLTKKLDVIGREELKQIQKKYNQKKKELEKKAHEKTISMKKLWNSRSLILPKYKSPILKIMQNDEKKKMELEEKKQNKKNKFYEDKKKYFKDIVPLPKINDKLRKDAIKKNFSMLDLHGKNRVKYIKEELNQINKMRKNSFDIKNKRFKQSNSLVKKYKYRITSTNKSLELKDKKIINGLDLSDKINTSIDLNNKNQNLKIKITSPIKKLIKRNPKEINYLKEFENKPIKNYNWDKYIAEDEENKAISIQNVKNQVKAFDNKLERKQMLLKIKGGYKNDKKTGNDIGNLLIETIQGKLSIINAINKEEL